jgi:hypothetical protein
VKIKRLWLSLALLLVVIIPLAYWLTSKKVLAGQIYDGQTREPIQGAKVVAEKVTTITDQQGYYRLEGVEGELVVSVQAPGYLPFTETCNASGLLTRRFTLDIALQPNRLRGVVYDELSRLPVSGAIVSAGDMSTRTDAFGQYELQRIAGQPDLIVQADGYLVWQEPISPEKNLLNGSPLDVTLIPNTIMGLVRDAETNAAIENAVITVDGGEVLAYGDGNYELRRVRSGTLITVTAPGYQPAEQSFAGGTTLVLDLHPREVMFLVSDAFSGRAISGATITGSIPVVKTDQNGRAVLSRVVPGETITVRAEGYASGQAVYTGQESISLTLRPTSLQGVVRDASTGQSIAGAMIYVDDRVITADANGFYLIPDLPAQPTLVIKAAGYRKERVIIEQAANPVVTYCADSSLPCADLMLTPFQVKGIYIPLALLSLPDRVQALIDLVDRTELNAIVVDVKGDRGGLAYTSQVPLAQELGGTVGGLMDLQEFLRLCKERGIYTIARLVIFKDSPLASGRPDWAIKRADGTAWTDNKGLGWTNPFRQEVRDYNVAIAVEVAQMGFDEIQVDYVRFPSDGDVTTIVYEEADNTMENRTAAINGFLEQLRTALQPWQVFTSVDLFGLTVSVAPSSDMGIGQKVDAIAPLVDYLCPMIYPSTYISGNFGFEEPANYPYEVVYRATRDALQRTKTKVRPWLQHYSWRVPYGLEELRLERQAAEDAGSWGWTFWNAGGRYDYEELFTPQQETTSADGQSP